MSGNPLQQYFRQPKIFVGLPSKGAYNPPGSLDGDVSNMPVFGMTGMDEIIMKTPDALISGESTVKVIQSCCPSIKDAWKVSSLDANLIFAAIKIATFGNQLTVGHKCPNCNSENDYSFNLDFVVEHYGHCKYNNKLELDNITIITQPLDYKQTTDYNMAMFVIQQKLNQIELMQTEEEKVKFYQGIFEELAELQNDLYFNSIERIEIPGQVVEEREYILEWLKNCDKSIFDLVRNHIESNKKDWELPPHPVKCTECETESSVVIELDQTNFFVSA